MNSWFEVNSIDSNHTAAQKIRLIQERFKETKKWVLVITNDQSAGINLPSFEQATSKILRVHANKVSVKSHNITNTLLKGNCSAVVLCDASLSESEVLSIEKSANEGKTLCVLMQSKTH
ncbi:hypothetical protein ACFSJY_11560 [Thalassotalea euphylliae]|uniref:hypothetical protein n=1 Tax=Thalassotalea euphylliae TaxID=1655234 RepID=UPI0036310960